MQPSGIPDQGLQLVNQPRNVKSIDNGMMNLNGQREDGLAMLFNVSSESKNRSEMIGHTYNIEVKTRKGCPRDTRYIKQIRRRRPLREESGSATVFANGRSCGCVKQRKISVVGNPHT